jgi:hypothetical protein
MAIIDTETGARRLARAIASDLLLYNQARVVRGIEDDTLFEALADDIAEGRALYRRRVSPALHGLYDRALVDVLVMGAAHVRSWIW